MSVNEDAKAFSIVNIHLLGTGITGLILSLSRWQANRLLKKHPFSKIISNLFNIPKRHIVLQALTLLWRIYRLINRFVGWTTWTCIHTLIMLALFFLPIILMGYYVYVEFFLEKEVVELLSYCSLGVLISISLSTIVSGLVLFTNYMGDFLHSFIKDLSESSEEMKGMSRLVQDIIAIQRMILGILKLI